VHKPEQLERFHWVDSVLEAKGLYREGTGKRIALVKKELIVEHRRGSGGGMTKAGCRHLRREFGGEWRVCAERRERRTRECLMRGKIAGAHQGRWARDCRGLS
jgi:hypothetical protein